jgi:hypothetical protein
MSLFHIFSSVKDVAVEVIAKRWFNQTQKRYGNMTKIQIDSQRKHIDVELDLKGESLPLRIEVKCYQLESEIGGQTYISLGDIETSREWLNVLISDYFDPQRRRFKVPKAIRLAL